VALLGKVLAGSYEWQVRAAAAEALGECGLLGRAEAVKALQQAASDEDEFVARTAGEALHKLSSNGIDSN
jgi:HEAT repeat protein